MEPLRLTLFGGVKLSRGPSDEIPLPRKTQILLAYLASATGNQFPRDKLAGLIWADRPEEQARQSLRQCLFTLAKSIGAKSIGADNSDDDNFGDAPLIHADRHQVSLNSDNVEIDAWDFERLLLEDTPDAMQQAVTLHMGEYLSGLEFKDDHLDAWCAAERTRFRELCYDALAKLSSHYVDIARLDDAIDAGRRLVALDSLREDGHRTLMRIFNRAGRRAEALKQYRQCRDVLKRELNVEPEAATVTLYAEITGRGAEAAAVEQAPPPSDAPPNPPASAPPDVPPLAPSAGIWKQVIGVIGVLLIIVLAAAFFKLGATGP